MQQSQPRALRSIPSHFPNVGNNPGSSTKAAPTAGVTVGVYECEVNLKFRMIEEGQLPTNRDDLLEMLLEAFGYGGDEYLEALDVKVSASAISDVEASPEMRRQLIRLRNSKDLA
jgi:Npun R1517